MRSVVMLGHRKMVVSPEQAPALSGLPLHQGEWVGCSRVGAGALGNVTTATGVTGNGGLIDGGSHWPACVSLPMLSTM